MNIESFANALSGVGFPVAFQAFREIPNNPKITYSSLGEKEIWADNCLVYSFLRIELKLFTAVKDVSSELRVESFLRSVDAAWKKDETGNSPDSDSYMVKYTLEV